MAPRRSFRTVAKVVTFLVTVAMLLGNLGGLTQALAAESPSITSEFADYAPGSTVKLIGEGWQPGEPVHISVDDSLDRAWTHESDPDPVAGASGGFEYQFQIAANFIATYTVVATGTLSGQATTTFTDAIQKELEQWANDAPAKFQTDH